MEESYEASTACRDRRCGRCPFGPTALGVLLRHPGQPICLSIFWSAPSKAWPWPRLSIISIATRHIVYRYGPPGGLDLGVGKMSNPDDAMILPDGRRPLPDITATVDCSSFDRAPPHHRHSWAPPASVTASLRHTSAAQTGCSRRATGVIWSPRSRGQRREPQRVRRMEHSRGSPTPRTRTRSPPTGTSPWITARWRRSSYSTATARLCGCTARPAPPSSAAPHSRWR